MPDVRSRFRLDEASPLRRRSKAALLLIDVVNPMDFAGAPPLLEAALESARSIRSLKSRCREFGIPAVYVNDNFDCWHLGFEGLLEKLRTGGVPGKPLIDLLAPEPNWDFYILKPSHSGFFRTGLEILLERLGASTLILTGFAGDICVLFTANDGYMRGFDVVVPSDCVASESPSSNVRALEQMERLLKADTSPAASLDLARLHSDGSDERRGRGEVGRSGGLTRALATRTDDRARSRKKALTGLHAAGIPERRAPHESGGRPIHGAAWPLLRRLHRRRNGMDLEQARATMW